MTNQIAVEVCQRKYPWIGNTLRRSTEDIARHAFRWKPRESQRVGASARMRRRSFDAALLAENYTWNVSFAKHLATESDIEECLMSYARLGIKDSSLLHVKSKIYNTADDEKLAKQKVKIDNIAH